MEQEGNMRIASHCIRRVKERGGFKSNKTAKRFVKRGLKKSKLITGPEEIAFDLIARGEAREYRRYNDWVFVGANGTVITAFKRKM
jgi:hypothetical protein